MAVEQNDLLAKYQELEKELMLKSRELVIEAAIEKVRSRSLAMHHTEELQEVITIVFNKLRELNVVMDVVNISIPVKDTKSVDFWIAGSDQLYSTAIHIPYFNTPVITDFWAAQEAGPGFFAKAYTFDEKTAYWTWAFANSGFKYLPEDRKAWILESKGFAVSSAFEKNTAIVISSHSGLMLSEKEKDILTRFARVFEQAYTRFLDLQKAEAQARESQIQLALERVRAKTMAMQKSDELMETSQVLFHQLRDLGETADQISIAIVNEDEKVFDLFATVYGNQMVRMVKASIDDPFLMSRIYKNWKTNKKSFVVEIAGEELRKYNIVRNAMSGSNFYNEDVDADARWVVNAAGFSRGVLAFSSSKEPTMEATQLLERFAKVFESTYTRFLDLQKAETQAKEAKIEAALERVRSRTMGMQHSDELSETVFILFQQFKDLGENPDQATIGIINEEEHVIEYWVTMHGEQTNRVFKFSIDEKDVTLKIYQGWKAQKKSIVIDLGGKALHDFTAYRARMGGAPAKKGEKRRVINVAFFSKGLINVQSNEERSGQSLRLLERFAAVFEGTYTRFLDLKHAEERAREARIEASLERVRSKTMAMHNSADIGETVAVMFEQLVNLGVETTVRCGVVIIYDTKHMEVWTASDDGGKVSLIVGRLDMTIHPMLDKMHAAWENKDTSFSYELAGEDIKNYYRAIIASPEYHFQQTLASMPERQINNVFFFPEGALFAFTTEPFSAEATQLFKRFAGVFGQTYRRFLDLQRAEAQAKESKIEAGLERLRSKTMAMHNSREVGETVAAMFDECLKLGVDKSVRCGVGIISKTKQMEVWTAYADTAGKIDFLIGRLDMTAHQMLNGVFNNWQNKVVHSSYVLTGEDQKDYYRAINQADTYNAHFKLGTLPAQQFQNAFYFSEGFIYVFSQEQLTADAVAIFKRFAGIFGLTYRRYLDLQKAEAQAKEAQIEVALERVRSRTMAMQASDELAETSVEVFKQLINLGIAPNRLFIGIIKDNTGDIELWATDEDGTKISTRFTCNINDNASVKKMYDGWKEQKKSVTLDLVGKELKAYFHYLSVDLKMPFKTGLSQKRRVQLIAYFSQGCIGIASPDPQPVETTNLLERFASVFNLTYTRFNDLQKAEAQAREAVKQASIDRVRAEIASMRTTKDLEKITPLVWDELTTLGVPFMRCGVFIVDEPEEMVHYYLSTPDGKALAAFELPFDAEGIGRNVLQNWRQKHVFNIHWSEAEFTEYTKNLVKQGAVNAGETYVTAHPPTSLDLHFFPFLQGMLYVGNVGQISVDEMLLVQSLADAFSTAYARYEDFNKLEEAKQEVENTLTELKAAQTKLIQSEKMASLGELTAGIAHEIQNPLNFVNNFSEVNQEMIGELEEELRAGNIEDALAIAADIKQNEEKINHHGKRADGIVKGMLQHSRTAGGEKQPTNINMLADEFLRLSYHGLRAKDKTFNAEMVTHFDPDLPKINVISQDIGRVMLNLFNNAFYAVNQKQKTGKPSYKPEVSVTTSTENGQVIIKVTDNGTGIPDGIKDKIMQPFFTTKPTGEGTGLGLSLTYDMVVKGHGGTIKINSVEGEGSEFIISLPLV